jgi:uncharacterized DUF497 family protein
MDTGEERRVLIGMLKGVLVTVVFSELGESIRIISARRSNAHERKKSAEGEE